MLPLFLLKIGAGIIASAGSAIYAQSKITKTTSGLDYQKHISKIKKDLDEDISLFDEELDSEFNIIDDDEDDDDYDDTHDAIDTDDDKEDDSGLINYITANELDPDNDLKDLDPDVAGFILTLMKIRKSMDTMDDILEKNNDANYDTFGKFYMTINCYIEFISLLVQFGNIKLFTKYWYELYNMLTKFIQNYITDVIGDIIEHTEKLNEYANIIMKKKTDLLTYEEIMDLEIMDP